MTSVPPLIPGSKLYETLKVIRGAKITKATINSLIELNLWKGIVDVATTTNIPFLMGSKVVDGTTVTDGSIVLVKNQIDKKQNGIYIVGPTWTRSNLLKTSSNAAGAAVFVKSGTSNLNKAFVCANTPLLDIVGKDDLIFESIVLSYNFISGTNGGLIYNDNSNLGVDSATTDGAGNLQLSSAILSSTVKSKGNLISNEYLFSSPGIRMYDDSGIVKFDNTSLTQLGTTFSTDVPIISNKYSFTSHTSVSISYSTDISISVGSTKYDISTDGLNCNNLYYTGQTANSLSYTYAGTASGIDNTGLNDINFVIDSTSMSLVNAIDVINDVDVVAPNLLFEGSYVSNVTQQAFLTPSDGTTDSFGVSSSLYGDTLAVLGRNSFTSSESNVYIYTRSGNVWSEQQIIYLNFYNFVNGTNISLYEDTLAIGDISDSLGIGAVWIYTRTGSVWSFQQKITPNDYITNPYFGISVSLYQNTLVVGGPFDDFDPLLSASRGATWVFTRSGTVWTQQGTKLVGSGAGGAAQGICVSVYGDTLAVGGPGDDQFTGAVWIFIRSGTTWTQQGTKLVNSLIKYQGYSISLYQNTLAVSSGIYPGSTNSLIYTRTSNVWSLQTQLENVQGNVSVYGNLLAVGNSYANGGIGATRLFKRVSNAWSEASLPLVGANYTYVPNQGSSVSVYNNTIAVGGSNSNIGAEWVFVYEPNIPFGDVSGILYNQNTYMYIQGSSILELNNEANVINVPITSNKYEFTSTSTSVYTTGNVMTFKVNDVDILNVSNTQVSTAVDIETDLFTLGDMGVKNNPDSIVMYNTDTSMTVSSTEVTMNKPVIANKYAFTDDNYIGFASNNIQFHLETTLSVSLSQTTMNTSLPLNTNYLQSPVLGVSDVYNVSNSNNSMELGGGLYTLKGSVSDYSTAAWLQLSLQSNYLVSGRVGTNVPIVFRIQRFSSTTITNIQGTYSTYFTLTGSKLYFNGDYTNYSFSVLVAKSAY